MLVLWKTVQADGAALATVLRLFHGQLAAPPLSPSRLGRRAVRIPLAEAEDRGLVSPYHRSSYRSDFAVFGLAELADIEAKPLPAHLARLREDWDPALAEPIEFLERGGRLILYDGNHRLALARERGDATIEALIRTRRHCRQ